MPRNSQIHDFFKQRAPKAQAPPKSPPRRSTRQGAASPFSPSRERLDSSFAQSSSLAAGAGATPTSPLGPLPLTSSSPPPHSSICTPSFSAQNTHRWRVPPSPVPRQESSTHIPLPGQQNRHTSSGFLADFPSSSPTPLHVESPQGRVAPVPARSRLDEIKGSDEEDSDDSDDLPDLFAISMAKDVPAPAAKDTKPWETPRAKRRAVLSFDPSPLVPKHPKMDMKRLVAQARQYEKNDAIIAGIEELEGTAEKEGDHDGAIEGMEDMLLDQDESGKLLQALSRTGTAARNHWCFFAARDDGHLVATPAFPKQAAKGRWKFLSAEQTRSDHFVSGLVHSKQARYRDLPDKILLWILDEITAEKRYILRSQYLELVKMCEGAQLSSTLTERRISRLFQNLGALEEAVDPNLALTLLPTRQDSPSGTVYNPKDWANLCAVLELIAGVSDRLSDKARERTIHILLRLGIDDIVHDDATVGVCFREAIREATNAVPDSAWKDFCTKLASSLYVKVDDAWLRWGAIFACLDGADPRLHQLQRALALASCGITDLIHIELDMVELLGRLSDPEFVIQPGTDHFNLAALAATLAVAIGDGDKPDVIAGNPGIAQRDTIIDAVVQKLKEIESRIHFSTMYNTIPRMASKSQLGNLQVMLLRVTRSREPRELGILASPEGTARRDIPKQQNFMQKFLEKGKSRAVDNSYHAAKATQRDGAPVVRSSPEEHDHGATDDVAEALAQQIERETASAAEKARGKSRSAKNGAA